jgi:Cu/Ag efflux pump CusA
MAWVIIGGLITSTLLARLVTPVMYKLMPPDGHEPRNLAPSTQPDAAGVLL